MNELKYARRVTTLNAYSMDVPRTRVGAKKRKRGLITISAIALGIFIVNNRAIASQTCSATCGSFDDMGRYRQALADGAPGARPWHGWFPKTFAGFQPTPKVAWRKCYLAWHARGSRHNHFGIEQSTQVLLSWGDPTR
jgi:hypothetical protein